MAEEKTPEQIQAEIKKAKAEAKRNEAEAQKLAAEARKAAAEATVAEIVREREEKKRTAERASDEENHVYRFTDKVTSESVRKCITKLTEWHRISPDCDIEIVFFSPGGSIIDGMALFDFIQDLRVSHTVTTGCTGMAASMAGILLQAGDIRWTGEQSWIMIHRAAFGAAGKALSLSTPIRTMNGWRKLVDISIGDTIFDERGIPTEVTGVYDVDPEKCYRVNFSDGSSLIAADDHLWTAISCIERTLMRQAQYRVDDNWASWKSKSGRKVGTYTTEELAATINYGKKDESNWLIPTCAPLDTPNVDLPIDPYLLGYWLGDGVSIEPRLTVGETDSEWIKDHLTKEVGLSLSPNHKTDKTGTVSFTVYGVRSKFSSLGLLGSKHVPEMYLNAGTSQRLALLQGLLDSDGYASPNGTVEFCSTSRNLAEAVLELAVSLGQKVTLNEGRAILNGKDHGPKFRVCFTSTIPCFRLPRKAELVSPNPQSKVLGRFINSIEEVDWEPMRCLTVDSPNHLFLAGDSLIPTHNTFEVEDEVEFVKRIEARILDIFVLRSKLTAAKIKRNWDRRDWWISSEEALKLGLVDEVRGQLPRPSGEPDRSDPVV